MNERIDFFIYAALIGTFWFIFAARIGHYALLMVAKRNSAWLASQPAFRNRLSVQHWFPRFCYVWGASSLAVLTTLQMDAWPPSLSLFTAETEKWVVLKDSVSVMFIIGLIVVFRCVGTFSQQLKRVPLAKPRRATLEHRTIDNHLPQWFRRATYATGGVHLAAWLAVGAFGLYSSPKYWDRCAMLFVLSAIFFFVTKQSVERPALTLDRTFGERYRREEVRFAFAIEIVTATIFAVVLYRETTGIVFLNDRELHLALVVVIVCSVLRFVAFQIPRTRVLAL